MRKHYIFGHILAPDERTLLLAMGQLGWPIESKAVENLTGKESIPALDTFKRNSSDTTVNEVNNCADTGNFKFSLMY